MNTRCYMVIIKGETLDGIVAGVPIDFRRKKGNRILV